MLDYVQSHPYLSGVVILVTAIAILLRRRFTYWSRRGVPGPNRIEIEAFIGIHHDYSVEAIKKYGRVYGSYDFMRKLLVINEPDLLRDIMVKDFHIFPDHKHFNVGTTVLNQSLFFMPGDDDWKRVRSILSPAFTSGKLKAMMSHISDISDKFVNNLDIIEKKGQPFDMRAHVGAFAMDVISACAYGINTDAINNPDHEVVKNAKKILGIDINLSILLSVLAPPLAKALKMEAFDLKAVNYFDSLTNQILKERKRNNKYSNTRRTDFVQLMLDSEKTNRDLGYDSSSDVEVSPVEVGVKSGKPKGTLSADELTAQGILFFIAGYDTTSSSITNATYYLSQNKEIQQKLYEELQTVGKFTYENLVHLKYLNAVINETLRLAPSLTRIQRECIQDYKLGNTGITVPAGTSVEILPYALHRDPDFWPEPNEFKPERFLEPKHHPYAYIPFGGGPRICIGQRFALNEMRMCLAKLINRFEFSLAPGAKLEFFKGNILMTPKNLMVEIKTRN